MFPGGFVSPLAEIEPVRSKSAHLILYYLIFYAAGSN